MVTNNKRDLLISFSLGLVLIGFFVWLQQFGLGLNVDVDEVSYLTAFLVGLVASVSSCMAVVGGLVLSLSASVPSVRSHLLFHLGRLGGFFVLGGIVGALGGMVRFSPTSIFVLTILVSFVMLVLGIKLTGLWPAISRFQFHWPQIFKHRVLGLERMNHILTPLLLGIGTFFLPCGFTQSMQIYTLSTGTFWTGAFTMFVFALGTLPILALLSFSGQVFQGERAKSIFMKTASVIVIYFALFNLYNGLLAYGVIGVEVTPTVETVNSNVHIENGVQVIEITAREGYTPQFTKAQANLPTILKIKTVGTFDCSGAVSLSKLNFYEVIGPNNEISVDLGKQSASSTFVGTCAMGMYNFQIEFE